MSIKVTPPHFYLKVVIRLLNFFFVFIFFSRISLAQWTLKGTVQDTDNLIRMGNVGIGYNNSNLSSYAGTFKFDVLGNSLFNGTVEIRNNVYLNGSSLTFRSASNFPIIFATRNVGGYYMDLPNIGAINANGIINSTEAMNVNKDLTLRSRVNFLQTDGTNNGDPLYFERYKSQRAYGQPGFSDFRLNLGNLPDGSDRFQIGCADITSVGSFKAFFQVDNSGIVTARKVVVTQAGFADYVFDDNYELQSLEQIESFVKANKHLPGIPSEKEVVEKGLDTGEMLKLQMAKIEELTLHLIAQQKEIEALKLEMKGLK